MSRFVHVRGIGYVNMDKVKNFYSEDSKTIRIEYDDGSEESTNVINVQHQLNMMLGRDFINQVIHSQKPIIAVYENNDGSFYTEDIEFLGLSADGSIYGLRLNSEGWFEIIEECVLYYKEEWTEERIALLKHRREELLKQIQGGSQNE